MEGKLVGVRQGELYVLEDFGPEGKYPTGWTMWPLFQDEIDKHNEPQEIIEYAREYWREAVRAGDTEVGLEEFANACEDESQFAGELFPGDITDKRFETENLVHALAEEQKDQLRECFDIDFDDDPEPTHTKRLVTWTLVSCGSIFASNQEWDVLFDPELWKKIQDCESKREMEQSISV